MKKLSTLFITLSMAALHFACQDDSVEPVLPAQPYHHGEFSELNQVRGPFDYEYEVESSTSSHTYGYGYRGGQPDRPSSPDDSEQ